MTTARKAAKARDEKLPAPTPRPLASPNRWRGTCETCQSSVEARQGRLARTRSGDIVIVCSTCAKGTV